MRKGTQIVCVRATPPKRPDVKLELLLYGKHEETMSLTVQVNGESVGSVTLIDESKPTSGHSAAPPLMIRLSRYLVRVDQKELHQDHATITLLLDCCWRM